MDADTVRLHVATLEHLELTGSTRTAVRRAVASGSLVRVHPGRFVARERWDAGFDEDRHLLRVVAAHSARAGGSAVFSHESAAVLWGLPLFRHSCGSPRLSGMRTNGRTRQGPVRHHEMDVPDEDRAVVSGIPCTSLERTVFDLIRATRRETSVALADAALRLVAWDDGRREHDNAAEAEWRTSLLERIARAPGVRGIRQARRIADFANGRAQLPGESVSRLYLDDLGFAPPRLQVPFRGPHREDWHIDFSLDDVGAWGEFDGTGKYFDPAMRRAGSSDRDELMREKEREDWIRGRSGRPVARWGMPHITSAAALRARLAVFHVFPPR